MARRRDVLLGRREFSGALASLAFGGLALSGCSTIRKLPEYAARTPGFRTRKMESDNGFGPLERRVDDKVLIDLPDGFEYKVVSCEGEALDGKMGGMVPGSADGMGSFALGADRVVLVRNHELKECGGTTTIVYDCGTKERISHHRSLTGTSRNCAGGATPWGTWLSCEEQVELGLAHGWVYQVPALHDGLVERQPLRQLGRFNHEAAAVDPETYIVYLTEDRIDGLFYRFVPDEKAPLTAASKGKLQALVFDVAGVAPDSRNWSGNDWKQGECRKVRWETLGTSEAPAPTQGLRRYGHSRNAVLFACGEGIHFGQSELYFTATSGGSIKSGQIFRYRPSEEMIELFLESTDPRVFNYGDNLTVAPNGDLIVCEDAYVGGEGNYLVRMISDQFGAAPGCGLRGVKPDGRVYKLAWLPGASELAGVCFSADGQTLFVNIYDPAATLAITGPKGWQARRPGWRIPEARGLPV